MSRAIKFRVFCEKHNRWEYYSIGDLICGAATSSNGEGGEFKADTWTQFTGLHDKNGKDCYEGDIVKRVYDFKDDKELFHTCEIKFVPEIAGYCFYNEYPGKGRGYTIMHAGHSVYHWEVVGNIYEHPHLLNP